MTDLAQPTATARKTNAGKLVDAINIPVFLFIAATFLLPLADLNCGPVKARFSGADLAFGTAPTIETSDEAGRTKEGKEQISRDIQKEFKQTDPLLALIPICGLAGAFLTFRAFQGGGVNILALRALSACLALLFTYYGTVGFSAERDFAKHAQQDGHVQTASISKTDWFKMGLGASWASLALTLGRGLSPRLRVEDAGVDSE